MVEIRYEEKNTVRLPNNIRQMGTPGEQFKIYIEDYVMTYLNQVTGQKPFGQKAAILLGEVVQKDKTDIFFISAAIHIEQIEIKEDSLQITSEIWNALYAEIEQYFKEKHILGWFLSRPGQSVGLNGQIERIQAEQFCGKGVIFYAFDPTDREDAFYIYTKGQLTRQQGYYIYYERNEAMQNYMVEKRQSNTASDETERTGFQNRLYERKMDGERKQAAGGKRRQRNKKWMPQAATVLLVILIVAAVRTNISSKKAATVSVVSVQPATEQTETSVEGTTENLDIIENIIRQAEESVESGSPSTETEELESQEVVNTYKSYTVKEGDTLLKISRAYYQNDQYVETIIQLNQIEDPDYIYPGMVLQLP